MNSHQQLNNLELCEVMHHFFNRLCWISNSRGPFFRTLKWGSTDNDDKKMSAIFGESLSDSFYLEYKGNRKLITIFSLFPKSHANGTKKVCVFFIKAYMELSYSFSRQFFDVNWSPWTPFRSRIRQYLFWIPTSFDAGCRSLSWCLLVISTMSPKQIIVPSEPLHLSQLKKLKQPKLKS